MNRALTAILTLLVITPTAVSAQSYVESNARDTVCEWSYKGKSHIDICHITAMGTHGTGALVLMFTLDNKVYSLVEEDGKRTAATGSGDFWHFKAQWRGTYRDQYDQIDSSDLSVNTVKLSNGYTIKLVY